MSQSILPRRRESQPTVQGSKEYKACHHQMAQRRISHPQCGHGETSVAAERSRSILGGVDGNVMVGMVFEPTSLNITLPYSLRNVERRPVLCSFKRIEGGSAYQRINLIAITGARETVWKTSVLTDHSAG